MQKGLRVDGTGLSVDAADRNRWARGDPYTRWAIFASFRQPRRGGETLIAGADILPPAILPHRSIWPSFGSRKSAFRTLFVLLQQRYQAAPRPGNLYDLAEALHLAGREARRRKPLQNLKRVRCWNRAGRTTHNRDLVFYYADHAQQPAKALKLAEQEFAWRHDVYTLDAYAWALHVNGQDAEARKQIETALAVGIRDANLFLHAGAIALKSGDRASAERYLTQSAELNSEDSARTRKMLAGLTPSAHR